MSARSRAATASSASAAMCRSSASRAPVSTITCWIVRDLGVAQPVAADARQHPTLGVVGQLDGAGEQRRRLALAQVVADRLAGDRRVAERADDVVAHLERVTERQPVAR